MKRLKSNNFFVECPHCKSENFLNIFFKIEQRIKCYCNNCGKVYWILVRNRELIKVSENFEDI